jgi:hypothetical protein
MRLVRRTIWSNHQRVLELLENVRGAVFWAIVSYGVGSLAVRFIADVASRFDVLPPIGRSAHSGWAGWSLLLLVVALLMAGVTVVRYRLNRRGGIVGWLSPALFAGGAFVSALVLSLGFAWQKGSERSLPNVAENRENAHGSVRVDPSLHLGDGLRWRRDLGVPPGGGWFALLYGDEHSDSGRASRD